MKKIIHINDLVIEYELIRRKRKTIELKVDPSAGLVITAPENLSIKNIEGLILKKRKWIIEKKESMEKRKEKKQIKKFENGEKFMLLGYKYPLEVIDVDSNTSRLNFINKRFVLEHSGCEPEFIKDIFVKWYKKYAQIVLNERVKKYSKCFEVSPKQIKAKEQKKIWGSCTHDNKLLFNWRLAMAPNWVIDYVVVHEMCHMVHKNHSNDFWNLVEKTYPNYQEAQKWLKENSLALDIVH